MKYTDEEHQALLTHLEHQNDENPAETLARLEAALAFGKKFNRENRQEVYEPVEVETFSPAPYIENA